MIDGSPAARLGEAIASSPLGTALRESVWLYPTVETVHAMFRDVPTIVHANRDIRLPAEVLADRTMDDLVRVGAARRDGDWLLDA